MVVSRLRLHSVHHAVVNGRLLRRHSELLEAANVGWLRQPSGLREAEQRPVRRLQQLSRVLPVHGSRMAHLLHLEEAAVAVRHQQRLEAGLQVRTVVSALRRRLQRPAIAQS